jgi:hypothetical protein
MNFSDGFSSYSRTLLLFLAEHRIQKAHVLINYFTRGKSHPARAEMQKDTLSGNWRLFRGAHSEEATNFSPPQLSEREGERKMLEISFLFASCSQR